VGEGVWNDIEWVFDTDHLIEATSYRVNVDTGLLYFREGYEPDEGPQALKVVYTGGMAATTEKFMLAYPDIAQAIARQVAYLFNTRHTIGATSIDVGATTGASWQGDVEWLPGVKAVLDGHRRSAV